MDPDDYLNFPFDQATARDVVEAGPQFGMPEDDAEAFLAAYEQGTSRGLCDGFSLAWIAAKLLDSLSGQSGPQSRQGQLSERSYLRAATWAQTFWQNDPRGDRALGGGRPLAKQERAELPAKATELEYTVILTSVEGRAGLLENSFVARIVRVQGSATQLSFPVGGGAHSIAFYRSNGGKVYIFDPNHGEYQVRQNLLARWLIEFLNRKYSAQDALLAAGPDGESQSARGWKLRRWYYVARVERGLFRTYGPQQDVDQRTV
jgi:hypothetical protein